MLFRSTCLLLTMSVWKCLSVIVSPALDNITLFSICYADGQKICHCIDLYFSDYCGSIVLHLYWLPMYFFYGLISSLSVTFSLVIGPPCMWNGQTGRRIWEAVWNAFSDNKMTTETFRTITLSHQVVTLYLGSRTVFSKGLCQKQLKIWSLGNF